MKRKPFSERWNIQLVQDIWRLPWKLRKENEEPHWIPELPATVEIDPEVPELPNEETEANDGAHKERP